MSGQKTVEEMILDELERFERYAREDHDELITHRAQIKEQGDKIQHLLETRVKKENLETAVNDVIDKRETWIAKNKKSEGPTTAVRVVRSNNRTKIIIEFIKWATIVAAGLLALFK
jgi:hypothetical protein